MRFSILAIASMAPTAALAAPTYDAWIPARAQDAKAIANYFVQLSSQVLKTKAIGVAPSCDLANVVMPVSSSPLPDPAPGLTLKHVAVGRGTQNYTCDLTNSTAIPKANGAVATLYDTTCLTASTPTVASTLTDFALQYNLPVPFLNPFSSRSKNPANLLISGDHFFTPEGVPFFNLETTDNKIGSISCKKLAETPAPEGATLGQGGVGEGTVAWLKLGVNDVSTGNLQEVYRLNTAGGKAPKTCEGMPPTFEVQYAAEYWFFAAN